MSFKNELWQYVASGHLDAWLAKIKSITNKDTRRAVDSGWPGWLLVESASSGYAISQSALGLLMDEIPADWRIYHQEVRDPVPLGNPPRPTGAAADGGTLTCNDPGGSFAVYVFGWDPGAQEFEQIGQLSENATPGAGYYVLACTHASDPGAKFGLPNGQFLQIS